MMLFTIKHSMQRHKSLKKKRTKMIVTKEKINNELQAYVFWEPTRNSIHMQSNGSQRLHNHLVFVVSFFFYYRFGWNLLKETSE